MGFPALNIRPSPAVGKAALDAVFPPVRQYEPTTAFLTALGYSRADWDAIRDKGIKDLQPWLVTLRALDNGRLDNQNNGYSSRAFAKDHNGWVGENTDKPTNENPKGSTNWGRDESVMAELREKAPGAVKYRAFHLVAGWDSYEPGWLIAYLSTNPEYVAQYGPDRMAQISARHPLGTEFYVFDGVNEVTNGATNTDSRETRGWRVSEGAGKMVSLRDAALSSTGLTALNGDYREWIYEIYRQIRARFPTAKRSWTDFDLEQVQPPENYAPSQFTTPTSGNLHATSNQTATNKNRIDRLRYEIWLGNEKDYQKNPALPGGKLIDTVGYQFHVTGYQPQYDFAFIASLEDWNRMGVLPRISELNVADYAPGHIASGDLEARRRFASVYAHHQLELFLTHTEIEEITAWSLAGATGGVTQAVTDKSIDNSIRVALMLAISKAKPPSERTIRRGGIIFGRYNLAMILDATGTQVFSANRLAQNAAGFIRAPWRWFNAEWMKRPIGGPNLDQGIIFDHQFAINASLANGTVLHMLHNADDSNKLGMVINGSTLRLQQTIGGSLVTDQVIGSALVTGQAVRHRYAGRLAADRQSIKIAVDGAGLQTIPLAAPHPLKELDAAKNPAWLYGMTRPDGTLFTANLSTDHFGIRHTPDHPTDADLVGLSAPFIPTVWAPSVGIYYGD